jgi:cation transport ATPase
VASLERYSRHPLAGALMKAGDGLPPVEVSEVHELAGQGLIAIAMARKLRLRAANERRSSD